jgi:hypothetical protein
LVECVVTRTNRRSPAAARGHILVKAWRSGVTGALRTATDAARRSPAGEPAVAIRQAIVQELLPWLGRPLSQPIEYTTREIHGYPMAPTRPNSANFDGGILCRRLFRLTAPNIPLRGGCSSPSIELAGAAPGPARQQQEPSPKPRF